MTIDLVDACIQNECNDTDITNAYCYDCSSLKRNIETGECVATCPSHLVDSGTSCDCGSDQYYDERYHLC